MAKFIYRHFPDCAMTVVEINPGVIAAAEHFFKLPTGESRLEIVVGDGADFIAKHSGQFDLILVDGFGADARPGRLDSLPFYEACRDRLAASGLLSCNLLGRSRGFSSSVGRIRQAFGDRAIAFPSCDSGNAIAFAAVGDAVVCSLAEMRERALIIKKTTGLDLLPTISRLQLSQTLPGNRLTL